MAFISWLKVFWNFQYFFFYLWIVSWCLEQNAQEIYGQKGGSFWLIVTESAQSIPCGSDGYGSMGAEVCSGGLWMSTGQKEEAEAGISPSLVAVSSAQN